MASGAIIRECPMCEEWIWEDEDWVIDEDVLRHEECAQGNLLEKFSKLPRQLQVLAMRYIRDNF